ncbi:MAG: dihydrodipicolinate reductase C-terminal domain-containing protein [Candidatus Rhabdochlamydia sp.]
MSVSVLISGKNGRMGKALLSLLEEHHLFSLAPSFFLADVVIDFSSPAKLSSLLEACVKHQNRLVIGTTGYEEGAFQEMQQAAKHIPLFYSPNFSLGMNLLLKVLSVIKPQAQEAKISIRETHHLHKQDAPSGSSLSLAEALDFSPSSIESIRSEETVGIHTVSLEWENESLCFEHQAADRAVFAKGALKAALFLIHQAPGYYTMKDLIDA